MQTPRKRPNRTRPGRVHVRVDRDEYRIIQANAENTGLTPAEMMRRQAVEYQPGSVIDPARIAELVRLLAELAEIGRRVKSLVDSDPANIERGQARGIEWQIMKEGRKIRQNQTALAGLIERMESGIISA